MRSSHSLRVTVAGVGSAVALGVLLTGVGGVSLAEVPVAAPSGASAVSAADLDALTPTRPEQAARPGDNVTLAPAAARTRAVVAAKPKPKPKPTASKPKPKPKPTATRSKAARARSMGCDASKGWQQRRGAYTLRHLSYDYRKLGYTMVFKPARSGITGMTYLSAQRIEVYVRPCKSWSNARMAETVAHEIGHAIDFARGTAAWHRQWQLARGISLKVPWYGTSYAADFATPAGDFAESFAAWQVPNGPNASKWGRPTKAQLKVLVPLMQI